MYCRAMRAPLCSRSPASDPPESVRQSTQAQFAYEGYNFRPKVDEQARMAITGDPPVAPSGTCRARLSARVAPKRVPPQRG